MKIVREMDPEDILFLDIETVRIQDKLEAGTPLYHAWEYKMRYQDEGKKVFSSLEESFEDKAALSPEFGKIVCITVGWVREIGNETKPEVSIKFKSFYGENEKDLLTNFLEWVNKAFNKNPGCYFFGHAIKGFDLPYILRRCVLNGLDTHYSFDVGRAKPWELKNEDLMDIWKSGGFYSASLLAISTAFGLPSPKSAIDGSEVSDVYWVEKDYDKIKRYCQRDVLTLINVFRMIRKEGPLILNEIYDEPKPEEFILTEVKEKKTRATKKSKS